MAEAMNLTFGDLILLQIVLLEKIKQLDLSMQSGQYFSELLGKIEYQLHQLRAAADRQLGPGLIEDPSKPPV
jgi:hypothetical protein